MSGKIPVNMRDQWIEMFKRFTLDSNNQFDMIGWVSNLLPHAKDMGIITVRATTLAMGTDSDKLEAMKKIVRDAIIKKYEGSSVHNKGTWSPGEHEQITYVANHLATSLMDAILSLSLKQATAAAKKRNRQESATVGPDVAVLYTRERFMDVSEALMASVYTEVMVYYEEAVNSIETNVIKAHIPSKRNNPRVSKEDIKQKNIAMREDRESRYKSMLFGADPSKKDFKDVMRDNIKMMGGFLTWWMESGDISPATLKKYGIKENNMMIISNIIRNIIDDRPTDEFTDLPADFVKYIFHLFPSKYVWNRMGYFTLIDENGNILKLGDGLVRYDTVLEAVYSVLRGNYRDQKVLTLRFNPK
jgi:hypothetical protein